MTFRFVVKQGPAFVRSSPFGLLTESHFEQGDVVQVIDTVTIPGSANRNASIWGRLADKTYVCVDDGEQSFLVPVLGAIPNREPEKTKPLAGLYKRRRQ